MAPRVLRGITRLKGEVSRLVDLDIPGHGDRPAIKGPAAVTLTAQGVEIRLKHHKRRLVLPFDQMIDAAQRDVSHNRAYLLGKD